MDLTWVHRAGAIIAEVKDIQSRIIQLEAENEELRRENKRMGEVIKPQPCTKFEDAVTVKWVAKLSEETNEVIQETPEYRTLFENGYSREYPDRAKAAKDRIALELTDVIHVCVSWLNAMGYDEDERGDLHRRVNEKNKERGYF